MPVRFKDTDANTEFATPSDIISLNSVRINVQNSDSVFLVDKKTHILTVSDHVKSVHLKIPNQTSPNYSRQFVIITDVNHALELTWDDDVKFLCDKSASNDLFEIESSAFYRLTEMSEQSNVFLVERIYPISTYDPYPHIVPNTIEDVFTLYKLEIQENEKLSDRLIQKSGVSNTDTIQTIINNRIN